MSEAVLVLEGVGKTYPGPPAVHALTDVDLRVEAGEMLGVVGPSGSGKSTLLHIMGLLDRPSQGKVLIGGEDTSDLNDGRLSALRAHRIGFVFQQFFLLDGLSARENVAQGLLYRGIPPAERRERAEHALANVGLSHRLEHTPDRLSGGERQRVAIGRALVGDPIVLFADEPTGNLDTASGAGIIGLFQALQASGSTIVVITHEHEVAAACGRQVALRDGRVMG